MSDFILLQVAREPLGHIGALVGGLVALVAGVFLLSSFRGASFETVEAYARFCYGCFIKPHATGSQNQQDALESFYKAQAKVYDKTRAQLLRGREDMLGLAAAQLRVNNESRASGRKPIWVDVRLFGKAVAAILTTPRLVVELDGTLKR